MSDAAPENEVAHDTAAQQFRVGKGEDAAVLQYRLTPGRITFPHTLVPEAFRGQGIAQKLARAGLEHAKAEGLGVVPICPFVQSYVKKHPEYQPLVEK
jgi:predicted GNAT family acetyltransferase